MAQTGQTIRLPASVDVDFKGLQSAINTLRQAMSKVKPDSSAFKKYTKDLDTLQKHLDALTINMQRGFRTPEQLERFGDKTRELGAGIQLVAQKVGELNFEDLNLNLIDPSQLKQLNDLRSGLDRTQDQIKNFKTDQMREMVSESAQLQEIFSKIEVDVNTTDFDKTMEKMEKSVENLQKKAAQAKGKLTRAQTNLQNKQQLKDVKDNIKNIFSSDADKRATQKEFFKSNGAFQSGGNEKLRNYLQQLGVDEKTLEELGNSTAANISKLFDKVNTALTTKAKSLQLNDKIKEANAQVVEAEKELKDVDTDINNIHKAEQVLSKLNNLEGLAPEVKQSFVELEQRVIDAEAALKKLQDEIVNQTEVAQDSANAYKETGQAMENTGDATNHVANETRDAAAATRELDNATQSLSSAIKRWFGFREIINLTKKAIRDAINHIKELDATMTQIAVVTDMTTQDLWAQIGTYSAIAQQYGVTTNGVYQVSQLFYQQGGIKNLTFREKYAII